MPVITGSLLGLKGAALLAPKVKKAVAARRAAGKIGGLRGVASKIGGGARKLGRGAATAGMIASAGSSALNALEAATGGGGSAGAEAEKAVDAAQSAMKPVGDTYEDMQGRKKSKEEFKENIADRLTEGEEDEQEVADTEDESQEKAEILEAIRDKLEGEEVLSDEVLKVLIDTAGLPEGVPADWEHSCTRINLEDGIDDTDSAVLEQIAQHCRNHLYKYKPEAAAIIPGLDTQTTQVGPTAQEIEKVNPAAVNVDPETGAKFVDTQKLTMTLAGALGELARKVRRMEQENQWRDRSESDERRDDRKEENQRIYLGNWGDR